jgi:hypothetical protein
MRLVPNLSVVEVPEIKQYQKIKTPGVKYHTVVSLSMCDPRDGSPYPLGMLYLTDTPRRAIQSAKARRSALPSSNRFFSRRSILFRNPRRKCSQSRAVYKNRTEFVGSAENFASRQSSWCRIWTTRATVEVCAGFHQTLPYKTSRKMSVVRFSPPLSVFMKDPPSIAARSRESESRVTRRATCPKSGECL